MRSRATDGAFQNVSGRAVKVRSTPHATAARRGQKLQRCRVIEQWTVVRVVACERLPTCTRLKLKHGGGWVPMADGDGRALFQSVPLASLAHQTRARLRAARSRALPPPVDYAAFAFAPPARNNKKGKGKARRRAAAREERRRSSAVALQRSFRRARAHRATAAVAALRERAAARTVQTCLRRHSIRGRATRAVAAAAAAQCAHAAAVAALAAAARATAARRVAKRASRVTRNSPARAEAAAPRSPLRGPVPRLTIDLSGAEYAIVHVASELLRWRVVGPSGAAQARSRGATLPRVDIVWSASPLGETEVRALRRAQREDERGALPPRRNRFPQNALARKCDLFDMLMRAKQRHPKHFRFVPTSWTLPRQLASLRRYWVGQRSALGEALIIKPTSLSRGRGIFITKSVPTLLYPSAAPGKEAAASRRKDAAATNGIWADRQTLAQRYVAEPLTIDGFKFDLRLYVLVAEVAGEPRAFLHREGLVRFCATRYSPPDGDGGDDRFAHLSNYSVNKHAAAHDADGAARADAGSALDALERISEARRDRAQPPSSASCAPLGLMPTGGSYFAGWPSAALRASAAQRTRRGVGLEEPPECARVRLASGGLKWSLSAFFLWLAQHGHAADVVWRRLADVVAKTLVVGCAAKLGAAYRGAFTFGSERVGAPSTSKRCFELLGFDVMLDAQLKPHLLEVNQGPSLHTDAALDRLVKEAVVVEALRLGAIPAGAERAAYEADACHGFARVLPSPHASRARVYAELAEAAAGHCAC